MKSELNISPIETECLLLLRRARTWSAKAKNRILAGTPDSDIEIKNVLKKYLFYSGPGSQAE